jgi:NADH-quinone oxidoreductase subunit L
MARQANKKVICVMGGFVGIPEVFAANAHSLEHFLAPVFAESTRLAEHHPIEASQEYLMMGGSTLAILLVIFFAVRSYQNYQLKQEEETGLSKALVHKWYVDELYNSIIVNPLHALAGFFKNIVEKSGIDGLVNGVGKLVGYSSRQLRLLQSGQVGNYILIMVLAMVVFILVWFNDITIMRVFSKIF